jgi:FKBP-type peptidyl-prolyl cis-trans isomerase 2
MKWNDMDIEERKREALNGEREPEKWTALTLKQMNNRRTREQRDLTVGATKSTVKREEKSKQELGRIDKGSQKAETKTRDYAHKTPGKHLLFAIEITRANGADENKE